jgi:hypothetical protein
VKPLNELSESSVVRPLVSFARRVRDFWFAPGDPTTLGFVRICAGLVFLYVLLVSGPLLSSFYAPDGWIDREAGDALRKEYPWTPPDHAWESDTEPTWFTEMDRNGDGFVTRDEWTGDKDEFDLIDNDPKDGRISLKEANSHGPWLVIRPEVLQTEESRKAARQAWLRWNIHPARTMDSGQPLFSPFFHLETAAQRNVAHALALLIALLFTLGVGTRVTSVLAWITALCYVHRLCATAIFGMDTMMAIVLTYLMIGPSGAALSVDRLIANWRRRRLGLPEVPPEPSAFATLALRLLQVHFCIMYFAAGTTKLQGAAWWNGTAIWQTLTNYEFTPRPEAYTKFLHLLSMNRWVWELFNVGGAWGTVALEISLPFLIWNRKWRWLLICASVFMHTAIALSMGLTAFSLFMICILFAFVPPETVRGAIAWGRGLLARMAPRPAAVRREEVPEVARV